MVKRRELLSNEEGPQDWLAQLRSVTAAADPARWAIVNAMLIDGDPEKFAGVGGLIIENGKIVGSGPGVTRQALGDIPSVDLDGRVVLPGLIDTHVHLCWDASAAPVSTVLAELSHPELLQERAKLNSMTALSKGTTTLRDLGGPNEVVFGLRDSIRSGALPGPRVVASGEVITTPGGHCHYIGRVASGARGVRAAAADQLRSGADVLKVMATGGVHTLGSDPSHQQFGQRELEAIVRVAHLAGKRVTAHATTSEAISSAVSAGIDSIQHSAAMGSHTAEQMASLGVVFTPTLGTGEAVQAHLDDPLIPDHVRVRAMKRNRSGERVAGFQQAYRAGVPIAAGTDSGSTFVPHGSLPVELFWLWRAGMSPRDTIAAATSVAANELDMAGQIGCFDVGADADLVVVDADRFEDPRVLESPAAVVQRGRLVADRHGCLERARPSRRSGGCHRTVR
jgi:imidazolonepropionase-like amidohydrolase